MSVKNYQTVTGIIFLLITLLHLWRALAGWESVINGSVIPLWASWLMAAAAGYLAYQGFKLGKDR